MAEEEKLRFHELATKDAERFQIETENAAFSHNEACGTDGGGASIRKIKRTRAKKDPNAPKNPR